MNGFVDRITGPECPKCESNGTHQLSSDPPRFVCEYCGHRWHARREGVRTVIYRPVRCPECESKECPVQNSRLPIRYHKCRDCGTSFRSKEV